MIAKFTFNYNGGFEKKENAVFQQGSIGVDSYQVFAPFLTTTKVYVKTKRNGDLDFSLWKQLDYNSTIGGWLKTATQDELLVDGELKVVFKFNNLVSQETSLWVRKGTLIVPEMTTYEALRDYVENQEIRIDQIINGATDIAFDKTGTNLNSDFVEEAIKEVNDKANADEQNIEKIVDGTIVVKKAEQDEDGNNIKATYETKSDATSKLALKADKTYVDSEIDVIEEALASKEVVENKATDFATINDTKYPTTKAVKTHVDTNFAPKTRKILGLDLQDDILIGEFRTALGNATQSVAGLLSAEDKTHLDGLVALLESSDGDTIVDTIGEILAIFQNYPEGADFVTVLQGKVDKTSIVDNVTTDDATKVLSAKQGKALQDTKEALANKKSVINDSETEYPNSKAVKDGLSLKTNYDEYLKTKITKNYSFYSNIKSLFGNSIIAFYPLNEFEGTTVYDISGNTRNGVYRNTGVSWVKSPFGDMQPSPKLNGSTGLANIYSVSLANAFDYDEGSLCFQLQNDGVWNDGVPLRTLFAIYTNESGYLQIRKSNTNGIIVLRKDSVTLKTVGFTNQATSAYGFPPTKTFNIVVTWSVSKNLMEFYCDGYFVSSTTGLTSVTLTPTLMVLGGAAPTITSNTSWKGLMSNCILLDRYITRNEVMTYNELLNDDIKKISVIGDSITNDSNDFPMHIVNNANKNVFMRSFGIAGNSILRNMATQVDLAVKENADYIILELGANDNNAGDMGTIQTILETQIARLQASNPKSQIFYMNILPSWTNTSGTTPVDKSNLRNTIAIACENTGITCWDVSDWLIASNTSDGLHPNNQGSLLIARKIIGKLDL